MTATSIPEAPEFAAQSERTVWEALVEQLPDEATVLVGQPITDHAREVEIDPLVFWPEVGVVALEVKGGTVSVQDGEWFQSDGSGRRALAKSPIEQVRQAKHELSEFLKPRVSFGLGRITHVVVLPYTQAPPKWAVPDAPRHLVAFAQDVEHLAGFLAEALRKQGASASVLTEKQTAVVLKTLRATHKAVENAQLRSQEITDTGNQLTREQERVLALLRFQHRAQLIGGAGSGKTHLALMKARDQVRAGTRVALVCYSRGLARHFELTVAGWPEEERPQFVGLFHDLPVLLGAEAEPEGTREEIAPYYDEVLPRRLAELGAELPDEYRFEAIVVDEAQDFADSLWEGLTLCLLGGEDGELFVFADAHQKVFDREGSSPITLSPFPLDDNLRNTATIAECFAPLTPVEQIARMDAGVPVRFVPVAAGASVTEAADDQVEAMLDAGWSPGYAALLTTGRRHGEQIAQVDAVGPAGVLGRVLCRRRGVLRTRARLQRPRATRGGAGAERRPGQRASDPEAVRRVVTGAQRASGRGKPAGPTGDRWRGSVQEGDGAGARQLPDPVFVCASASKPGCRTVQSQQASAMSLKCSVRSHWARPGANHLITPNSRNGRA